MTVESAISANDLPRNDSAPGPAPSRASRTIARQAVVDTVSRPGARFGLAWIAILTLAAVFAPFIACSFPLLVKEDGVWWSPAIRQLTPSDVVWLIAFFASVALVVSRRVRFGVGFATVLWLVAFLGPCTLWPSLRSGTFSSARGGIRTLELIAFGLVAMLDLVLLIALPLLVRTTARYKSIVACIAAVLGAGLFLFPVRPPALNVYETYRVKQTTGIVTGVVNAPIPFSANDYQPEDRLQPPSWKHLMGTEQSGADIFARMLHASRIALSVGFIATGIAVVIGVFVGGIMGYFVGWVDILGMRFIEIFEAIPTLILLLTVSAFFGRNLYLMMGLIGLLSWTGYARFVRAEALRLRDLDFIHAAIAAGLPLRSVIFRHMLPNGVTAVIVNTSFGVASAILIESTLSFLGLGLVDEPSWGQLLNQARAGGTGFQWWIATFPGLAIFMTVFAYNLVGEAIRDAIDPRLRKRD